MFTITMGNACYGRKKEKRVYKEVLRFKKAWGKDDEMIRGSG